MNIKSSRLTFFFKIIFPIVWGILLLGYWVIAKKDTKITAMIIGMAIPFLLMENFYNIKKVEMDSKFLYISNFIKSIKVPISHIKEIKELKWIINKPITISLIEKSEFGDRITFIPRLSENNWLWNNSTRKELYKLIKI